MSYRAQGSLEYLLLIGGIVIVAAIILTTLIQNTIPAEASLLDDALSNSQKALNAANDNAFTPLTGITLFSATPGGGVVTIQYAAPGARTFLLVEEKDSHAVVDSLEDPTDFDTIPATVSVFGLPFYESQVESGGVINGHTYYYRLRACDASGFCLVSDVIDATPNPSS